MKPLGIRRTVPETYPPPKREASRDVEKRRTLVDLAADMSSLDDQTGEDDLCECWCQRLWPMTPEDVEKFLPRVEPDDVESCGFVCDDCGKRCLDTEVICRECEEKYLGPS